MNTCMKRILELHTKGRRQSTWLLITSRTRRAAYFYINNEVHLFYHYRKAIALFYCQSESHWSALKAAGTKGGKPILTSGPHCLQDPVLGLYSYSREAAPRRKHLQPGPLHKRLPLPGPLPLAHPWGNLPLSSPSPPLSLVLPCFIFFTAPFRVLSHPISFFLSLWWVGG